MRWRTEISETLRDICDMPNAPDGKRRLGDDTMKTRKHIAVAFGMTAALFVAGEAWAAQTCPVTDKDVERAASYADAVTRLVRGASSCQKAYQLLESCSFGTSGDNELADLVQSKCEPMFLPSAARSVKDAYKKAQKNCDKIAERNEGTMYQSFAAICRARASRDLAIKYSKRG
jgi:hypothetical protein